MTSFSLKPPTREGMLSNQRLQSLLCLCVIEGFALSVLIFSHCLYWCLQISIFSEASETKCANWKSIQAALWGAWTAIITLSSFYVLRLIHSKFFFMGNCLWLHLVGTDLIAAKRVIANKCLLYINNIPFADVFKLDPNFLENEEKYKAIKRGELMTFAVRILCSSHYCLLKEMPSDAPPLLAHLNFNCVLIVQWTGDSHMVQEAEMVVLDCNNWKCLFSDAEMITPFTAWEAKLMESFSSGESDRTWLWPKMPTGDLGKDERVFVCYACHFFLKSNPN